MRQPPTGEPCAGEPHARFGGRGGRQPFPTPIQHAAPVGAVSDRDQAKPGTDIFDREAPRGTDFKSVPLPPEFAERLFTYNYRLFDRYHRPVATLAVLADEQARWRPERFGYELFGCRHYLEFPAVKLLDYREKLEGLLADPNPFALVTAAHLLTQQTRRNPEARYAAKWRLARLLYERGWE